MTILCQFKTTGSNVLKLLKCKYENPPLVPTY